MAMKEEEKPRKERSRLIVRLGLFLISHSLAVSVVCCMAGVIAFLLLPVLAMNTYISENALMPGSANPMFSDSDVLEANKFIKAIIDRRLMEEGRRIYIPRFISHHMADVGAETFYHEFQAHSYEFHPQQFFSANQRTVMQKNNSSCSSFGINSVGIIRAPRGDGKEAIVLVTPYNSENIKLNEALSLGLAYSVFSLLSQVTWLAKDIVWVAADSRYGEYTSVASWLRDYHNPDFFSSIGKVHSSMCFEKNNFHERDADLFGEANRNVFKRAGTMIAALVVKVMEKKDRNEWHSVDIHAEASNGQMPNLDLLNIVNYMAVHSQGLSVKVGTFGSLRNSEWLKIIGEIMQRVTKVAKSLNPKWKIETTSSDFVEGTATLASSIYHQALGVPTGSHGAFRDYQVDAITLELSPRTSLSNKYGHSEFLLRNGRLVEGVIRSVNNLLEKFHHSYFLYFLTGPTKFVSVGVYMIAFALLVAPLPIVSAALYSASKTSRSNSINTSNKSDEPDAAAGSWKWLHSAKVVFIVHLWALIVSFLPYLISQLPGMTSTTSMLAWVGFSIFALLVLHLILGSAYSCSTASEWKDLKAVMIAAASVGLCLMSIINFSTAQVGAMFIVPMCLVVRPLRHLKVALSLRAMLVVTCNIAIGIIGFPPAALLILKGLSKEVGAINLGDFWEWAEFLWGWNSATYLYILLAHLPCWVLCMHILLHP